MYNISNNQNLSSSQENLLVKAFELAFFINPNKDVAIEIISKAFEMWDVICLRQEKRHYYGLKGRLLGNQEIKKQRVKVYMQEEQLLQRLIYKLSEEYEMTPNWCKNIDEEGLLICYLKHLLSIILKGNSFSSIIGISRVLHKYSNKEAVDLYMSLAPNRTTQDFANIERESKRYKSKLISQLKAYFSDFIVISRNESGERFEVIEDPNKFIFLFGVVEDCLERFKPWTTQCFKSFSDFIFNGKDPDEEDPIELKRIHSVIHYSCYTQLMTSLDLATPKERLEIPLFFLSRSNNDDYKDDKDDHNRRNPPNAIAELKNIPKKLEAAAKRRKNVLAGILSIIVDGKEKTTFNPITENYRNFQVSEDAEILEIRTKKDRLLLATYLFSQRDFEDKDNPQNYSIKLEAGQIIKLHISLLENPQMDEEKILSVNISYKETYLPRILSFTWKRFTYRMTAPSKFGVYPFAIPEIITVLIVFTIVVFSLYFYFKPIKSKEPLLTKEETSSPKPINTIKENAINTPNPTPVPNKKEIVKKNTIKPTTQNPKITIPVLPPDLAERGGDTTKNLSSIKKIYVKLQDETYLQDVESFIAQNSNIEIVKFIIEADAVLQYSGKKKSFLLVNKTSNILWQKKLAKINNPSKEDTISATGDLLKTIETTKNKQ